MQNIATIENNLYKFKSPGNPLFKPDSAQLVNPKKLTERLQFYGVPGLSIAAIHDNQIEWAKAYGTMDIKTGKPVTSETIFEAGSISKVVTAVMVMYFVQEGILDLDTDVNSYLKSWKIQQLNLR